METIRCPFAKSSSCSDLLWFFAVCLGKNLRDIVSYKPRLAFLLGYPYRDIVINPKVARSIGMERAVLRRRLADPKRHLPYTPGWSPLTFRPDLYPQVFAIFGWTDFFLEFFPDFKLSESGPIESSNPKLKNRKGYLCNELSESRERQQIAAREVLAGQRYYQRP